VDAQDVMIAIVDDDYSVRTSLARLMRSAGYETRAFANSEEYLNDVDGVAATDFACVILDLHLPGMSGLHLQEVINRRDSPVPVIVLTGADDVEVAARAVAAGAATVIRKPFDAKRLLRAVAAAVARRVPPAPAPVGRCDGFDERWDDPEDFVLDAGCAFYRPTGVVSFNRAVELVRDGIAAARRNRARDLVVNTTELLGFPSPDMFDRFVAAVEWAAAGAPGLRLAVVARPAMIHPGKFGVLVAANRGLATNIFPTEAEARAWLDAYTGR
jgi:DNA-binding response OmpR family regulator